MIRQILKQDLKERIVTKIVLAVVATKKNC
jgi:hypothetical protein